MPNGEIHYKLFKIGYFLEIPLSVGISYYDPFLALSHFLGYSFHRWCDNDIDLMGVTSAEGRMIKELPLIGYLFFGMTSIYGAIFRTKHRSFITHFPIVSTFIRLVFFFSIPMGILLYLKWLDIDIYKIKIVIAFLLGLSQADAIHYLADLIWNENVKELFGYKNKTQRK